MKVIRFSLLGLIILMLGACATGSIVIESESEATPMVAAMSIRERATVAEIPDAIRSDFRQRLETYLYADNYYQRRAQQLRDATNWSYLDKFGTGGRLKPGNDMVIEYGIVRFDTGDRSERMLYNGYRDRGAGSVVVVARFLDVNGNTLASVEATSQLDKGVFGGSMKRALDSAAGQLADFAKQTFL
jgi:hypothetical protein